MTEEQQLKLQAFLDGELPEEQAREVASWIARDSGATALVNELRNTRKALKESQPQVRVPEAREFYWSKIEREIQRLDPEPRRVPTVSWAHWLRRALAAGTAGAALVLALWIGLKVSPGEAAVVDAEMTATDSGVFTYRDYPNRTTLVWVSYPAER
jgi:anti-sigma factor RsiW